MFYPILDGANPYQNAICVDRQQYYTFRVGVLQVNKSVGSPNLSLITDLKAVPCPSDPMQERWVKDIKIPTYLRGLFAQREAVMRRCLAYKKDHSEKEHAKALDELDRWIAVCNQAENELDDYNFKAFESKHPDISKDLLYTFMKAL